MTAVSTSERLGDRVVASDHRVDEEEAHPRPLEDGLDDQGVPEEPAEAEAGDRDHRDQAFRAACTQMIRLARGPWRARADVVLAELLEHRRPHEPHRHRDALDGQHDRRQHEVPDAARAPIGNPPRLTPNSRISSSASQKLGTPMPRFARNIAA